MNYYDKVKKELTELLSNFQNSGAKFDEKFAELKQIQKGLESPFCIFPLLYS